MPSRPSPPGWEKGIAEFGGSEGMPENAGGCLCMLGSPGPEPPMPGTEGRTRPGRDGATPPCGFNPGRPRGGGTRDMLGDVLRYVFRLLSRSKEAAEGSFLFGLDRSFNTSADSQHLRQFQ